MEQRTLYEVNAFTTDLSAGNPAGVVLDAHGLSDTEMQAIAREAGHTTTAFLMSHEGNRTEARFFTPTKEIDMCGHATVALNHVLATTRHAVGTLLQQTKAGEIQVEITGDVEHPTISMSGEPQLLETVEDESDILEALGLSQAERIEHDCPIEIISTGNPTALIGIKDRDTLNRLDPAQDELERIADRMGFSSYYVFIINEDDSEFLTEGRVFAPSIGIEEDPATGTANGPLGYYLVRHGLVEYNNSRLDYLAKQGKVAGRQGVLGVGVNIESWKPTTVQIDGQAVVVKQETIRN